MRKRFLSRAAAAVAVTAIFTIGAVSPAQANIIPDPGASIPAKLVQQADKWRQYMLVLPGRLFGQRDTAGNLAFKSEIAAQRYSLRNVVPASSEGLNYMHNSAPIMYQHAPGTDDFSGYILDRNNGNDAKVLRGIERETVKQDKKRWFTGARTVPVSPTKGAQFGRTALGVFNALGVMSFEPLIAHSGANLVGGWMGQDDTMSQFCELTPSEDQGVGAAALWNTLNILTGDTCSNRVFEVDPAWEAQQLSYEGLSVCAPEFDFCLKWMGIAETKSGTRENGCWMVDTRIQDPETLYYSWPKIPSSLRMQRGDGSLTSLSMQSEANMWWTCSKDDGSQNQRWYLTNLYSFGGSTPDVVKLVNVDTNQSYSMPDPGEKPQILECEITLTDGRTLRSEGAAMKLADGQFSPPSCPAVPDGATVDGVKVKEKDGDTLYDEKSTPEYKDWRSTNPDCSAGHCLLDLRKMLTPTTSVSCFDLEEGCVGWFEESNREDTYRCMYNDKRVDIRDCFVYAGLFKPGRVEVGAPYSDPMTGDWSGGQNVPMPDRQAMGQRIQNPAETRSCNGLKVSGFDPVGFVMRPIQCALEWAFVPRPLVVEAEMIGGEKAWEKKPPKVIATAVSGFALTPAVSGCSRPMTMFAGGMFEMQVEAWNFCPGTPGAMIATASRLATTAAMVALVVIVVRRQIAGMVGYGAGQ